MESDVVTVAAVVGVEIIFPVLYILNVGTTIIIILGVAMVQPTVAVLFFLSSHHLNLAGGCFEIGLDMNYASVLRIQWSTYVQHVLMNLRVGSFQAHASRRSAKEPCCHRKQRANLTVNPAFARPVLDLQKHKK